MSSQKIKVAVDTRDLQIAASGARSYLESVISEFKKSNTDFTFYFLETNRKAYTGNRILLKLGEQIRYFYWKQIQLPRKARQLKCEIIFCSDFMVPYYSHGIKTIPVFHDAFFWEYPQHYNKYWLFLFKQLGLAAAKKASFVVTPTLYTRAQLSKYTSIPLEKMIAVNEAPKTIQPSINEPASNLVASILNTDYVLHVGTFEKRKNLPSLIKAFKIVKENGLPHLKLVLVGKASNKITLDDSKAIQDAIIQYQLQNDVILTGYLSDTMVEKLYQNAKLYAFPSINEGFGIPILEAFKYQVPVVISNNTCLPEVAGMAAIAFDPYNTEDIADAILTVLSNPTIQEKYKQLGQEELKKYSWEKSTNELLYLFKKAVTLS